MTIRLDGTIYVKTTTSGVKRGYTCHHVSRQRKRGSMETKEDFIREVRELLNANEKVVHVELNQIVDMVYELAESYRY